MSLQKAYQMTIIDGVFEAKLNPKHELLILAEKIDWERLCEELESNYSNIGRNGKPIRLMVGAHMLKHMFDMSDEAVVERLCGDVIGDNLNCRLATVCLSTPKFLGKQSPRAQSEK